MSRLDHQASSHRFRLCGSVAGVDLAFALEPGETSVGSAPSNRLVLPWAGISRRHALIQVATKHVVVSDRRSKNGTFINGLAVQRADLKLGDVVAFGPVELRLDRLASEDAELALTLPPVTGSAGAQGCETTLEMHRSDGDQAERLLTFIRSFVSELTAGPGGCGLALNRLAGELDASGACLLSLGAEHRGQSVLAVGGEIAPEILDGWVAELPSEALGRSLADGAGLFLSKTLATGYVVAASPGLLALVVSGDFDGREKTEPLFLTLLSLIRRLVPLPDFAATGPDRAPRLRFPQGYIRGASPAMERVYRQLAPLVDSDLPVLIRGETGVGKELVAETLHLSSSRRRGPFVAINCAAIPAQLLEAELFGIGERVATGVAGRRGQLHLAQGGTLFLDEVGEMPVELQTKLLRVLQEKKLRPLGGAPTAIDVRLLSATNADLETLIEEGRFRRDLYFRIAGIEARLPSLAERREDLPVLIEGLLAQTVQELAKPVRGLTVGALKRLVDRPWPGNVRELAHEIRRLVYHCPSGGTIDSAMIPGAPSAATSSEPTSAAAGEVEDEVPSALPVLKLAELEMLAIKEALRRTDGNQVQAAKLLGVSRHILRRRLLNAREP